MAAGVGIDLIEIKRVERALERRPRLAERLFTEGELAYARERARPGRHLAARFAAKEAVIKALGQPVPPREIEVVALLLAPGDQLSDDAKANLQRFDGARHTEPDGVSSAIRGAGVVVDAIFGTGFAGTPRDPAASAIEAMNDADAPVVAIDVASGVNSSTGEVEGKAVAADATVTFHAPKLGHWIAPGKEHTGELRVAPIGIPEGAPTEPKGGLIHPRVLELAPHRAAGSTKFSSGDVVVIGGARGLTGAVCMSSIAAIRTGAGYATAVVPDELEDIFEIKLTEVMTVGCPSRDGALRPA